MVIKKKLFVYILPFLLLLISCKSIPIGSTIGLRNYFEDDIPFDLKVDSIIINDKFFGIDESETVSDSSEFNCCKSAYLLTGYEASRVKAVIWNTEYYSYTELDNNTTRRTDYETIELSEQNREKYYYCGKLLIQPDVESHFFLNYTFFMEHEFFESSIKGEQSIWVFNVKNGMIISVFRLLGNSVFCKGYSGTFRENNVFVSFTSHYKAEIEKILVSNLSLKRKRKKLQQLYCDLYIVNEEGYIDIVPMGKLAEFYRRIFNPYQSDCVQF